MKVDEFHTYDDGLLKLDGKMPGISLRIKRPDINYQIGLLSAPPPSKQEEAEEDKAETLGICKGDQ